MIQSIPKLQPSEQENIRDQKDLTKNTNYSLDYGFIDLVDERYGRIVLFQQQVEEFLTPSRREGIITILNLCSWYCFLLRMFREGGVSH